ncbi:MAG: hypothetical protein GXP63_06085 [DPANN group archaeon]|nr:hypothetical protein [DPANN group archaeon]
MVVEIVMPTIPVVIGTALVDSINPCAIGVLILLIATLLGLAEDRKKMLTIGSIYIFVVFLTYLFAGFGLLVFIQRMDFASTLSLVVAVLVILMGLVELKDFFWYGKGISLSIPKKSAKKIMKLIDNVSVPSAIVLGFFVAAVELPCTGGPYLAITTLLAKIGFSVQVFWLLIVYNLIFVLPLVVILLLVYFGVKAEQIKDWKQENRKWMRLFTGIVLIVLGVFLLLWEQGIITFSLLG